MNVLWAAIIPSVASIIAAFLGYINHRKIQQVHVLVNARLDAALEKIASLKVDLQKQKDTNA